MNVHIHNGRHTSADSYEYHAHQPHHPETYKGSNRRLFVTCQTEHVPESAGSLRSLEPFSASRRGAWVGDTESLSLIAGFRLHQFKVLDAGVVLFIHACPGCGNGGRA